MSWFLRMIVTVFFLTILIYVYIGWRLTNAISIISSISPRLARYFVISFFTFLNLLPIVILITYGLGNSNQLFLLKDKINWLDYGIGFPFWIGLILIIEILPYFLSMDLLSLIIRMTGAFYQKYWLKWQAVLKICVTIFFIFYIPIRSYIDTNHIKIISHQIPIKNLPDEFINLNLTLVGDIQIDRYSSQDKIERFHKLLKKTNGEILFFAGDLVTNGKRFIANGLQELCSVQASLGRVACMGDHDFWADPVQISNRLINCGWEFLQNKHYLFHYKNHKILITGVTYIYSRQTPLAELRTLFANAPEADLKIVLVHQPAKVVLKMAFQYGYQLLLAGHTHGGQLVFHPYGISLTPSQFENKIYSGYKKYDSLSVVVTNGIGLTLAPLRYGAPAEVTKITLVHEN
jgi:predicted MPP superfamily phosphohydrolase